MEIVDEDSGIEMLVAYEGKQIGEVIYPNAFLRQHLIETKRARIAVDRKREGPAIKCNRF